MGDFTGNGNSGIGSDNLGVVTTDLLSGTVSVLLQQPLAVEVATIQTVATVPFQETVAIISGASSISNTTATINWGDGSSSTEGTILDNPDGTLTISSVHTYALRGTFSLNVKATDWINRTQRNGQALVQVPLVVTGLAITVSLFFARNLPGPSLAMRSILSSFLWKSKSFSRGCSFRGMIHIGRPPLQTALFQEALRFFAERFVHCLLSGSKLVPRR